ncbi:MAG: LysR family transcriptional regulator [Oceanospirillaceae bacterium]|nr:LysR family transcriptional regulator [Oceanospirillaceae bacterium]
MDITLSEIRSFHALVKYGSFTRAAEHLGVSQPAITAQVRRLEARTKQALLERYRKEVKATAFGIQLFELSCEYVNLDAAVDELFNSQTSAEDFVLRVATSSTIIFMPLMAVFRQHYPNSRLKVISGTTEFCRAAVLNREADIGLFPMLSAPKNIDTMPYHKHSLVAVLNPTHPLAPAKSVDISAFFDESIIGGKPDSFTQQYTNQLFSEHGFTPKIDMQMALSEQVCDAVALNLGIGFCLRDDIRRDDSRYRLVPINGEEDIIEHVSWLKLQAKKTGVVEFLKVAKAFRQVNVEMTEPDSIKLNI